MVNKMLAIFEKEFKGYFTSPIAYVFMSFFLFMFGLYSTIINVMSQNGDYSFILSSLTIVLMFTTPILTMRLLSEEKRNKTDQLLLTAPIKVSDIVIGKYLSAIALLGFTLLITMLHSVALSFWGDIPIAKILGSYLGYFLLGATLIAIGLYISSICESQIVAAIATIGVFLLVMLINNLSTIVPKQRSASFLFILALAAVIVVCIYFAIKQILLSLIIGGVSIGSLAALYFINGSVYDGLPTRIFQWLAIFSQYDSFVYGLLDVTAIIYYLSFIVLFIFLTMYTIQKRSWN
jgi:ABC-2 type transport system permease protein